MIFPLLLSILAFGATLLGGLTALRHRDNLHRLLGYTAGVILGVVAFDLLPEIFQVIADQHIDPIGPMIALVIGFLAFHIIEKSILIHHSQEHEYGEHVHHHPQVGMASALALSGHSFLDGVGIGLGFHIDPTVGIAVAIAVLAHDFSDGLNTVALMLTHKNTNRRAIMFLLLDAAAPILGAASTYFFHVSDTALVWYLGFFAGFLLYIGASEILPEAHSKHSSYWTIAMTLLGVITIFVMSRVLE